MKQCCDGDLVATSLDILLESNAQPHGLSIKPYAAL